MDAQAAPKQRPSAPVVEVTADISIQPPLCRRGKGPGLVLVVSAGLDLSRHESTLDPPPRQKWAEEGYAVAQILVDDGLSKIGEQLAAALAALEKLPECLGDKFGVVGTRGLLEGVLLSMLADQDQTTQSLRAKAHQAPRRSSLPSGLTQRSPAPSFMGAARTLNPRFRCSPTSPQATASSSHARA